jgi:hypothetical protein
MKAIVALMEFGYPKARIDHVGDAPTGAVVENSFKFVLNISDEPLPGPPESERRRITEIGTQ